MSRVILLALLALASGYAGAQEVTRYITDNLKLESRSGPGVKNRIVRMLPSGTPLKVLEQSNGWSRIKISGEADAWILSRYLMDQPSARNQVTEAKALAEGVEARIAKFRDELASATQTAQSLETERSGLATRATSLAKELAELKRTAASAVAVQNENKRLRLSSADAVKGLEDLRQEYILLKNSRERDWFIAGAGVLLGGIVLGLIIPKISFRRRRGWGEL